MNFNPDNMTPGERLVAAAEYERGYQAGLYDGLMAAHKNSDGRIPAPTKRIVMIDTSAGIEVDGPWFEAQELDRHYQAELIGTGRT